jgi:DNA-directed RNA polymerase subunit RPC12/RpoP
MFIKIKDIITGVITGILASMIYSMLMSGIKEISLFTWIGNNWREVVYFLLLVNLVVLIFFYFYRKKVEYIDIHCPNCGNLIKREILERGNRDITCPKCNKKFKITIKKRPTRINIL